VKNYFCRLGFLDGAEGLIYHLNHSVYIHWKYVKAWDEQKRSKAEVKVERVGELSHGSPRPDARGRFLGG